MELKGTHANWYKREKESNPLFFRIFPAFLESNELIRVIGPRSISPIED